MQELLEIFPFVKQTLYNLEKQNKFLNKVTLTGKINALDVAANLFEFTDKTVEIFDELKIELINALLQENINKVASELNFKAKTTIDILIRNLFERTADVGFLSTDRLIIDFLQTQSVQYSQMYKHLEEYASKYSVYNEIVIFDTKGFVKIHLNKENNIYRATDDVISQALQSESYIEQYAHSDIFPSQEKTLLYAQRIEVNNQVIGVLCLCFKFEDEMQSIFKSLLSNNEVLSISTDKEVIISSSKQPHIKYQEKPYIILNNKNIAVTRKTSGYQGYYGISQWFATACMKPQVTNISESSEDETLATGSRYSQNVPSPLLSAELHAIIEKANNIIEDISDVIINGELIASKQRVYLLTPILENLRSISESLLHSVHSSIKNLESVVEDGLVYDTKMASHLAIDIMDRNLYERANDCRWWALTPLFEHELMQLEPNIVEINATLRYINELYTVYTNIFIYNTDGVIVAASNNSSVIGNKLTSREVEQTLANTNSQNYFVSDFAPTPLYDNKPTYIYNATILSKNNKVVGGIGVVFDAEPEFKAILEDSFPSNKKGFMIVIDKDKKVICSNNADIAPCSKAEIPDSLFDIKGNHAVSEFLTFNERKYIVASSRSNGYREYKVSDNYKNDLYSLCFIEI